VRFAKRDEITFFFVTPPIAKRTPGDGESERAREESGLQYANEIIAGVLRHAGRPQPPSPAPSRHKRKGFYRPDLRKVFCGHFCGVENEKIIGEVIQEQANCKWNGGS